MNKEHVMSNTGTLFGIAGIGIATIPLIRKYTLFGKPYNAIVAILCGIIGLYLTFTVSKKLKDDVVTGGFVLNSLAIVAGIITLGLYFVH
jgi:hypothetical protein